MLKLLLLILHKDDFNRKFCVIVSCHGRVLFCVTHFKIHAKETDIWCLYSIFGLSDTVLIVCIINTFYSDISANFWCVYSIFGLSDTILIVYIINTLYTDISAKFNKEYALNTSGRWEHKSDMSLLI
jgi:intracellular septation protein A